MSILSTARTTLSRGFKDRHCGPVSCISGQIKSVGSDTLNDEMALWAKGFEGQYSGVKIEIEGKGSATAPPALLEGASQFAPMLNAFDANVGHNIGSDSS